MKAVVYTEYGSPNVLHVNEVPTPTPADNEVLVKVYAVSVNFGDLMARNFGNISASQFNMPSFFWLMARIAFGLKKPKNAILGSEFSGRIEAVGKEVTAYKAGDAVFGYTGQKMGTYAEYLTLPADGMLASIPENLSFEQAAAIPYGGLTALNLLRKMNIKPGQHVLIIGASGGIGAAAVQLAKHYGAHVTGICGTPRIDYVKSLGADAVIDYTREDFTKNGQVYDLIFDVLGRGSFNRSKQSLKKGGTYLMASFKMKQVFQMMWTSKFGSRKLVCALSSEKPADLLYIRDLIAKGNYKAVIDRVFPMAQASDAHRYVESGSKQGSVVITPVSDAVLSQRQPESTVKFAQKVDRVTV